MEKSELVEKYGKARLAGEGICLDRGKDIEIKGEYPEWRLSYKERTYTLSISQCARNVCGEDNKKGLCLYRFTLIARQWEKHCGMNDQDIKKAWDDFCAYNNWENYC